MTKSNVLPFPALRAMPPDPPPRRWWQTIIVCLGALVVAVGVTVAAMFLVWLVTH